MAPVASASLRRTLVLLLIACMFLLSILVIILFRNKESIGIERNVRNFRLRGKPICTETPEHSSGNVSSPTIELNYTIRPLDLNFDPSQLPRGILEYMKWHRRQLQNPDKEIHYVIYLCDSGCGGLGDRLRGIVTLFYYSILTQRVFGIVWTKPVLLQNAFNVSHVDWIAPGERCDPQTNTTTLRLVDQPWSVFQQVLFGTSSLLLNSSMGMTGPKPVHGENPSCLFVNTNAQFYHANMWNLGLRRALDLPENARYEDYPLTSWALNTLFQPTKALDDEYHKGVLKRLNITDDQPFVAVHVRLGGNGASFHDPSRHSISELPLFAACARSMQSYVQSLYPRYPSIPIFIASDLNTAKLLLSQLLNNESVYLKEEAFHIDRSNWIIKSKYALAMFRQTIAEFMLLIRSKCLVASRSGFSDLSVLWSAGVENATRCWSWYHVCMNTTSTNGSIPWYTRNKLIADPEGFRDGFGHVIMAVAVE